MVGIGKLRQHFLMMEDGAGDDIGEVGRKQQVVGEIQPFDFSMIGINHKRDLGEGEKRDADRQDNIEEGEIFGGDIVYRYDKKVNIFEKPEKQEVESNRSDQPPLGVSWARGDYLFADKVVSGNGC
jgi:hypothetical protein